MSALYLLGDGAWNAKRVILVTTVSAPRQERVDALTGLHS
jgi:hypothetical protein